MWIGGDSAVSCEGVIETSSTPKVWTPNPGLLLGFAGDGAAHTALLHRLKILRPPSAAIDRWVATEVLEAFAAAFVAHGLSDLEEEQDWECLIGVDGRNGGLWVATAPAALDSLRNYGAVGSASQVALGALAVTQAAPPETRCRWALEAAARHAEGVRPPFRILSTKC